jgi:hypothetical protein
VTKDRTSTGRPGTLTVQSSSETVDRDSRLGHPVPICRLIHVVDQDATVLGQLPGTDRVTLARKTMPAWVSLYTITPKLSSAVYRELARAAGVHIYNERDDAFYASRSFVALHANGAGPRTILFPSPCSAVNVMTREQVMTNCRSFTYGFQDGETLILRWQAGL